MPYGSRMYWMAVQGNSGLFRAKRAVEFNDAHTQCQVGFSTANHHVDRSPTTDPGRHPMGNSDHDDD